MTRVKTEKTETKGEMRRKVRLFKKRERKIEQEEQCFFQEKNKKSFTSNNVSLQRYWRKELHVVDINEC